MDPKWEEPPPEAAGARRRGIVDSTFVTELRRNPGKWARVDYAWKSKPAARSYGNSVRGGYNTAWTADQNGAAASNFEFKVGPHPDEEHKWALWVTWNGPKAKASAK